jgi:hypothetical protein
MISVYPRGMDDSTRRRFLRVSGIVGTVGLAGCSQLQGGSDIQDSDGDGVIDSEDYAPRDPSVQDAEDVEEVDPTEQDENEQDQPTESDPNTDQPQGPEIIVIDDFESGSLSPNWRDVFDTSNVGTDAGRSVFTIRSSTTFDGQYVLQGNRSPYSEGGSTITRDDFMIQSDGATITFHAKFGETYTGAGRPNRVDFRSPDGEIAVRVTQRLDRAAKNIGFISDESLRGPVRVELRNISFQDQQVEEVAIDSEIIDTNIGFNLDADIDSIDMVVVEQGHWRQAHNIVVDDIQYSI